MRKDKKNSTLDAAIIEQRIKDLKGLEERGKYKEFWKQVRDMGSLFKYSHLSKDDRKRLWADYDSVCKKVKGRHQSQTDGAEDARLGKTDLPRYATDSEYRAAYEQEETKRWSNLYDLESGHYLTWYHQLRDDRRAEHELEKTERRAAEERKIRDEIRRKRWKEIRKLGIATDSAIGGESSLWEKILHWFGY
ncbi:MAG: hypothetical protein K9N55_21000 [Phycisphaerae bacterium]|nr:hypothetical protein [Phycisphaerae bacterium]